MDTDSPLSPEARAREPDYKRHRIDRQLARVRPGSRAYEVAKRATVGVYTNGFIYAGNLAYLALMTLFPFFIVAAAVLSVFGESDETQRAVASFLHVLPPDVADLLRKPIRDVLTARTGALLWLGALVGLWTVGSFVETVRDIFSRAYGIPNTQGFWRSRLSTTLAILLSVILVLFSFFVQGLLTATEHFIYQLLPFARNAAEWVGISRIIPGAIMFGALYMLFYSITPAKYRFSDSRKWPGALFTTVWWVGMTAGLPWVLGMLGGYDLTYGSLAGVVVMLLFFYLIGLGFVFGAELNAALAEPARPGVEETDEHERSVPAGAASMQGIGA